MGKCGVRPAEPPSPEPPPPADSENDIRFQVARARANAAHAPGVLYEARNARAAADFAGRVLLQHFLGFASEKARGKGGAVGIEDDVLERQLIGEHGLRRPGVVC